MSRSRSGTSKRLAAGVVASALMILGLAPAPNAGAVDDVNVERIAGTSRYGTAAAIAGQTAFDGATTAILATGENFPDALAASALAGANAPAPILLTTSSTLSSDALAALDALGVTDVIVVGGTAAVSDAVVSALGDEGYNVTRVAGQNRYGTAARIAQEVGTAADFNGLATAVIATGLNFPDALAGGAVAYVGGFPLLLTSTEVPAPTEDALNDLGVEQVIILGGTAAVPTAVETSLEAITGNPAIRLAGSNRFGTAAEVAEFGIDEALLDATEVLLAAGFNFPDALAGGPLGGELTAPILLMGSVPAETAAFLTAHAAETTDLFGLGGTAAITNADLDAAEALSEGVMGEPTVALTAAPELIDAELAEITPGGDVDVRYIFDGVLDADVGVLFSGQFHLNTVQSNNVSGDDPNYIANSAALDPSNDRAVIARFIGKEGLWPMVSVAAVGRGTVEADAVNDDGPANPEGSRGIQTVDLDGESMLPNLIGVGNVQAVSLAGFGFSVTIDFTFDRPVSDTGATNGNSAFSGACEGEWFFAITTAGNDPNLAWPQSRLAAEDCANGTGYDGEAVWTLLFESGQATLADAQAIADDIVAGQAAGETGGADGPVSDSYSDENTTQVRAIGGGDLYETDSPDLTSASLQPADNGTDDDFVEATFDEDVECGGGYVVIVYLDGDYAYNGTCDDVDADTLEFGFTNGEVAEDEIAYVLFNGSEVAESVGTGFVSYPAMWSIEHTYEAGATDAPRLVSATRSQLAADDPANPFEPMGQRANIVTYEFDQPLDPDFTPAGKSVYSAVYDEAGTRTAFSWVAGVEYCEHDDDHGQGEELIICTVAEGANVTPDEMFLAIDAAVSAGVEAQTVATDNADLNNDIPMKNYANYVEMSG